MSLPILDVLDFNERVVRGLRGRHGENDLPADLGVARSLVPAGTASLRDFSYIAPEIPEYIPSNCTGCMDCVTECPDTAILGKVLSEARVGSQNAELPEADREMFASSGRRPRSTTTPARRRPAKGACSRSSSIPSKCKGCAECVTVCDDNALKMIPKNDDVILEVRKSHRYFKQHRAIRTPSTSTTTC